MTFMTREEVRQFPIPTGVTVDLFSMVGTLDQLTGAERESWVEPAMISGINIGDAAYVHSYGQFRRGVVTKVGRKNVTVTFTTKGAVDRGMESPTWGTKVTAKSAPLTDIRVYRPADPTPAVEPELGFQKEIQEAAALDRQVETFLAAHPGRTYQEALEAAHAGALELEAPVAVLEDAWAQDLEAERVLADRQRAAERWVTTQEPLEADQPEDGLEVPTKDETLAMIGGCWAGGALTGKALKAWADGDYILAAALATDQKALQETGGPDALHPEHQDRVAQAETLADVAREVLELVEDGQTPALAVALVTELKVPTPAPSPDQLLTYSRGLAPVTIPFTQLAPGVLVAPIGTPAPTAEDLSDLALALTLEDLEHLGPDETLGRSSEPSHIQPRDVVTIHRGDRLYSVLEVQAETSRDMVAGTGWETTLMARVEPVDPEDERPAQWVNADLLHVRRPLARVVTEEITERVRQTREVFALAGEDRPVHVRTVVVDSRRLPYAVLIPSWSASNPEPVATLRVGESIVVDGRCFAVTVEDTEQGWRAHLEPAPHRDRHQG